jgi:hypothetical protein
MLTQFGFSLITPLLMCLVLCWWLNTRIGLGSWVYILGFFFGLGGSGTVAYKLYLSIQAKERKRKKRTEKSTRVF